MALQGSHGTPLGLALRLGQLALSLAAVIIMHQEDGTHFDYQRFDVFSASMILLEIAMVWSFAHVVLHSVCLFYAPAAPPSRAMIIILCITDWMTSFLLFGVSIAATASAEYISRYNAYARCNKCFETGVLGIVYFAFTITSFICNIWLLASLPH